LGGALTGLGLEAWGFLGRAVCRLRWSPEGPQMTLACEMGRPSLRLVGCALRCAAHFDPEGDGARQLSGRTRMRDLPMMSRRTREVASTRVCLRDRPSQKRHRTRGRATIRCPCRKPDPPWLRHGSSERDRAEVVCPALDQSRNDSANALLSGLGRRHPPRGPVQRDPPRQPVQRQRGRQPIY
jgi:hypothetical protein